MNDILKIVVVIFLIHYFYTRNNEERSTPNFNIETNQSKPNKKIKNNGVDFYIRPLGNVDRSDLTDAVRILNDFYGYNCKIESGVELNENMKIDGTDEIINVKYSLDNLERYQKTVFIVDKRLWWANKEYRGYTNGSTVIIRGDKKILRETLIHEIGHTLGLGHCNDLTCVMAVDNDQYDSGTFCKKCRKQINTYE
jgi:hypothetical protein